MNRILDEHREHLADEARLSAYARAIGVVVTPGDVVVDLGAGSGILGLLACRAGAQRVYAIDSRGVLQLAREVAADNGLADRIVHVRGRSTQISLPEPADVVVCDQLGPLGFDAGVVEEYDDARQRLLKPAARMIPCSVTTWLAPAEAPAVYAAVDAWRAPRAGFRFDAFRRVAVNTPHRAAEHEVVLLAAGAPCVHFDLAAAAVPLTTGAAEWTLAQGGVLHGLCGWFTAQLAPGVEMTNAPGAAGRIRRRPALLPLDRPVAVAPGDRLAVRLQVRPAQRLVRWRTEVRRGDAIVAAFDQATLHGLLLSPADLVKSLPAPPSP